MRGKRTTVALIDEPRCIGCALCIDACPVDAIVGARGLMHTVLEKLCIGCDMCVPACPVDCIEMLPTPAPWSAQDATAAKQRAAQRKRRLERLQPKSGKDRGERRAVLAAALARARRR